MNEITQVPIRGHYPGWATIRLTDAFELVIDGRHRPVAHSVERLLAYLGLANIAIPRAQLAGELWGDGSQQRAASNLRTTLWRLQKVSDGLVRRETDRLVLTPQVLVDVNEFKDLSRGIIAGTVRSDSSSRIVQAARSALLPGWDESWVIVERERLHISCIEALETLAMHLIDERRHGDALRAASEAVHAEPLRESGWRLVVQAHLAQGNVADALRAFRRYRRLLHDELGIRPSPLMRDLVAPVIR
jgi:DNA-binding SARP family transcriptional activator